MKVRMFFGAVKTTCIALVVAIGVAVIVLDSVMLSGAVSALTAQNEALAWVSLVAGALIAVFAALLLFNSHYRFADSHLVSVCGVFVDKIAYDDVEEIVVAVNTYEIFLRFRRADKATAEVRINVSPSRAKDFLAETEKRCARAVVSYVQPPADKDNDNEKRP